MNGLLRIIGRGLTADVTELIWHWFEAIKGFGTDDECGCIERLEEVICDARNKKFNSAREKLNLYLFENPDCTKGRLASAALLIQERQIQAAIQELNSVYMRQPSNTMALYALGYCYEIEGCEAEAVEFYQDCLKFKRYLQLPRQRLAGIYFKNGRIEKTAEEYQQLREEYPGDMSTYVCLGHLHIQLGQYQQAIDTFTTAILIQPDNTFSSNEEVEEFIQLGDFDAAIDLLDEMLEKEPDRADYCVRKGDIFAMQGATQEAAQFYQQALDICPDYLEAIIKMGTQFLQANYELAAAQHFNKALELNEEIVDAYIGLSKAQKLSGLHNEAAGTLALAAAIDANSPVLFAELASLIFRASNVNLGLGDSELEDPGAVTELMIRTHQMEINENPTNPNLNSRMGMLMRSVGREQDALSFFEAVLQANPHYSRAENRMLTTLHNLGRVEDASNRLSNLQRLGPQLLQLHYEVAILYCDTVKFASSLLNLEQSMEKNLHKAEASVNIELVLQNLGLLDKTEALWDSLTETAKQSQRIS